MNAVDVLLTYWEKKSVTGQRYSDIQISRYELNVIAVKIMSWLSLEHKRSLWICEGKKVTHKPLKLDMQYPWCINLKKMVEEDRLFRECFSINNDEFDFSSEISEQEKASIREKVYTKYRPEKHAHH